MSQKRLQETLDVQAGSISEIVAKLVKRGCIERKRDEQDGRRWVLTITEHGLSDLAAHRELHNQVSAQLFGVLAADEKEQLLRLLDKLCVVGAPPQTNTNCMAVPNSERTKEESRG